MGKVTVVGGKVGMEAPIALPPVGTKLDAFTWEQISVISQKGLASKYFSVGDYKTIVINGTVGATNFSELSVRAVLIGIDHNSSIEGINRMHFQIGRIDTTDICLCDSNYNKSSITTSGAFIMNTSLTSAGGWSACHMRKTVLGSDSLPSNPTTNTLLSALPSDLRAVMKPVTKYSDNTGGGTNTASYVTATEEFLWLLADFEVFGTCMYSNSAEQNHQKQYDYYKAGNSVVRYKHNAKTTAAQWLLRSPNAQGTNGYFCTVSTTGKASHTETQSSFGVAPAFAV